jgi:hypothetical protein
MPQAQQRNFPNVLFEMTLLARAMAKAGFMLRRACLIIVDDGCLTMLATARKRAC